MKQMDHPLEPLSPEIKAQIDARIASGVKPRAFTPDEIRQFFADIVGPPKPWIIPPMDPELAKKIADGTFVPKRATQEDFQRLIDEPKSKK